MTAFVPMSDLLHLPQSPINSIGLAPALPLGSLGPPFVLTLVGVLPVLGMTLLGLALARRPVPTIISIIRVAALMSMAFPGLALFGSGDTAWVSFNDVRWLYVVALAPLLTDWLENGHMPATPRESIAEIVLGGVITGVDLLACRQHARIQALADKDPASLPHVADSLLPRPCP